MKRFLIGNLEILYDDGDESEINRIKSIINNNPSFFASHDKETIRINDFDNYFKDIVASAFIKNSDIFSNKDSILALFIVSLVRNNPDYENSLFKLDVDVSDDLLNALIAYKYYEKNGSFSDFIKYLMERQNTDKILEWLYTEYRWDTYNYLLEISVNTLKDFDFKFLDIMSDMVNSFLTEALKNYFSCDEENKKQLPLLSYEQLDSLFCKFLNSIKAPQEWVSMYYELKENNKIHFVEVGSRDSECCLDDDGLLQLIIENDGTIDTFYTLVHEFIHYVTRVRKDLRAEQFSIAEFPSIFYEKMASRYLNEEGYSLDVVNSVMKMRNKNNSGIYLEKLSIFMAIIRYINDGELKREDMIKFGEEQFKIIQQAREKFEELSGDDFFSSEIAKIDVGSLVDKECDSMIDGFMRDGLLVIDGYQYIVGTFLAEGVLEKADSDSMIFDKMIRVTENLTDTNLENILVLFDIENIFSQAKEKSPVKVKE